MIHLERLTWDNYDDVLKLKVAKEQKEYIVPNSDSLIHAFFAKQKQRISKMCRMQKKAAGKNRKASGSVLHLLANDDIMNLYVH